MLQQWHETVKSRDPAKLQALLADEVNLHSPVIHRTVEGKAMVSMYLTAALHTFANETFTYDREFFADNAAVLEFSTEIDGIYVNGIDMITFNEQGKIIDFKVMVRPLKAINLINDKMTALLEKYKAG
ncbi:nuclear transport factor 2 family protein [Thalassotalea sp. M1531]|uniref:Nuclear transport factor 2 family protein n=1 Tax=Thalassotalea algicola TaxID=2716224 RepID=A0A7Y0LEK4_9GAMM|nr:nuclear transport factor 2 family protein [Thalassotalea algicola]NMP33090.1 nuclear transport factor 2 family protein [Thalassotalea algicola]